MPYPDEQADSRRAAAADQHVLGPQLGPPGATVRKPVQPERTHEESSARTASMVSASAGRLSGRYRRTRAKRRATPPG